ncbi:MAG TPA: hypothetical protein VE080_00790 [Candidatus Aquicultoraceae bacterium]|nr:hypothetical protein [Candidatus Aquicultoraceae bacterium]
MRIVQGATAAAKQNSSAAASFPRRETRSRPGSRPSPRRRNGANQDTAFPSVHNPHATPASAARPAEGALTRRTESHAASVVKRSSVGS